MKKIIILLTAMLMFVGVSTITAQQSVTILHSKNNQKAENVSKKDKKENKAEQQAKAYEYFNKLAADSTLIFTGNLWSDRNRGSVSIDPTINFLIVRGEKAFFQFGLDNAGPGINGLGGASYEGRVVSYKYVKGKNSKKASRVLVVIKPDYYQSTITFNLSFFGDTGTLGFSGGRGQRISMDGTLNSPDNVNMMGSRSKYKKK